MKSRHHVLYAVNPGHFSARWASRRPSPDALMNLAADQSVWPGKKRHQKPRCSRCWPRLHHLLHITYESTLIYGGHSLKECSRIPILVPGDPAQIIDYFRQLAMPRPPQTDRPLSRVPEQVQSHHAEEGSCLIIVHSSLLIPLPVLKFICKPKLLLQ